MSDRDDADEESTDDLWEEVGEFDGVDSSEIDEFTPASSNGVGDVVEPDRSDPVDEVDPGRNEPVDEVDPTDDPSIGETFGDRDETLGDRDMTIDDSDGIVDDSDGIVDDSDGIVDDSDGMTADDDLPNTEDAPDTDEVFDEMDMSAVDGEALWDELAGAETEAESFDGEAASVDADVGEPIDAEPVEPSVGEGDGRSSGDSDGDSTGGTETLVDKRAYCQQCPYFSAPPEVSCSHDGTEIIEVIKDGRFRVRDCPVVTDTGPDRTILNDDH